MVTSLVLPTADERSGPVRRGHGRRRGQGAEASAMGKGREALVANVTTGRARLWGGHGANAHRCRGTAARRRARPPTPPCSWRRRATRPRSGSCACARSNRAHMLEWDNGSLSRPPHPAACPSLPLHLGTPRPRCVPAAAPDRVHGSTFGARAVERLEESVALGGAEARVRRKEAGEARREIPHLGRHLV